MLTFTVLIVLPDVGFDGGGLASVFSAMPVTGTLGIVVLRRTEALALTEHTAAALVRFSRAWRHEEQCDQAQ